MVTFLGHYTVEYVKETQSKHEFEQTNKTKTWIIAGKSPLMLGDLFINCCQKYCLDEQRFNWTGALQ